MPCNSNIVISHIFLMPQAYKLLLWDHFLDHQNSFVLFDISLYMIVQQLLLKFDFIKVVKSYLPGSTIPYMV